jgi:hypothetical protein
MPARVKRFSKSGCADPAASVTVGSLLRHGLGGDQAR